MRDFERRQHLLDFNPWWQDPRGWQERDPDLREARLNALSSYDPHPLSDIALGSLYLLMGPRRAGKSVAMKRAIAGLLSEGVDPRRIVFCPCEDLSPHDLRRIVKLAEDLTPGIEPEHRYWFFDEITYVSGWAAALKQLRDQTSLRSGCVVATGSSGAKLREAQGELGGREGEAGGVRLLLPMGFRAFVGELYPNLSANLPVYPARSVAAAICCAGRGMNDRTVSSGAYRSCQVVYPYRSPGSRRVGWSSALAGPDPALDPGDALDEPHGERSGACHARHCAHEHDPHRPRSDSPALAVDAASFDRGHDHRLACHGGWRCSARR